MVFDLQTIRATSVLGKNRTTIVGPVISLNLFSLHSQESVIFLTLQKKPEATGVSRISSRRKNEGCNEF